MKKKFFLGWVLTALFVLAGASFWEGAAVVSLNGELPEGGYYAATNSFPRDSSVIVTNLETGKSIRVTVVSSLTNPGLLTVLSREAAAAIGLQAQFIGRVRMTQPADPLTYSQFPEETRPGSVTGEDSRAIASANNAPGTIPPAIPQEMFPSPGLSYPEERGPRLFPTPPEPEKAQGEGENITPTPESVTGEDSRAIASANNAPGTIPPAIPQETFPSPELSYPEERGPRLFPTPSEPEKAQGENITPTPDLAWTYQEGGELSPNIPTETLPVFSGENREKDLILSEEPGKIVQEEDKAYVQDAPVQPIP
ncbi:MAG: septal ring lytic transglycosylase RlpA family protein, partial [Treponema sp.]|nr:septal ring lytic transglycosylase RlpA family protein [Treponema sp.]